jgi:glycerate-2-kinase
MIRNRAPLGGTALRDAALAIAEAALEAVDTAAAVRRSVSRTGTGLRIGPHRLRSPRGRLLLAAIGKCSGAAAQAFQALGIVFDDGIVLDVRGSARRPLPALRMLRGTHPMPSPANVEATAALLALLDGARAEDLVIAVVSGGGSTLLCQPPPGVTVADEARLLSALFAAGAPIADINTVRKHLSLARGGRLAERAWPARLAVLLFNDAPGAPLDTIASGPTFPDRSTVADARGVLARYGLAGPQGLDPARLVETPKGGPRFRRVRHHVAVSNALALEAMARRASRLGWRPVIVERAFGGEARDVAARVVADLRRAPAGTALLYGGESTVTVRGPGHGGRNAELALAALPLLDELGLVLCLASDGRDNSDRAGALADAGVAAAARAAGLDPAAFLAANDAYGFFDSVPGALETGPTGANVADLIVALRT